MRVSLVASTLILATATCLVIPSRSKVGIDFQDRTPAINDFEDGSMLPWFDESPGQHVHWQLEDLASPFNPDSLPVPAPLDGTKYLRVVRKNGDSTSGLAVLRTQKLNVSPGDQLSFRFWIRSQQPEGNNLQLYWVGPNQEEHLLSELSQYSTSVNDEWRTELVEISVDVQMDVTFVFYGYCGSHIDDVIAIDDIVLKSTQSDLNLPTRSTTTEAPTTTLGSVYCRYSGGDFDGDSGSITSPHYPDVYGEDNLDCHYNIHVVEGSRIYLNFTTFKTETNFDFVEVYDGETTSSARLIKASGYSLPDPVESSSNHLLVRFTTDSAVKGFTGFQAQYTRF